MAGRHFPVPVFFVEKVCEMACREMGARKRIYFGRPANAPRVAMPHACAFVITLWNKPDRAPWRPRAGLVS
ncbi:hypothetical protein HMPREF1640_01540 [Prevotella sp. S7-1-8]|nr:hypothetical protein HMPREF1640_01540 [Prevotella sp. S7-1-8]